jgi:hypothetical protein
MFVCFACMLALGAHGDIDGDARADKVALTPARDGFVLSVRTRTRVVTRRERLAHASDPQLLALRPVNGRRGLEIVVLVDHGAANDFIVFYTLFGGRLVPMTGGPHDPADPAIIWDVGGTIGTGYSEADCISRNQVGMIERWPDTHNRWHARAIRYAVNGTRFIRLGVYRRASAQPLVHLPANWPQVHHMEFEGCGGIGFPRQ